MKAHSILIIVVFVAALVTACGPGSVGGSNHDLTDDGCLPGRTEVCPCTEGQGIRVCADDGSGWSRCTDCVAIDDDPPTDNPPADNPPADNPPADNPPADDPPADDPPADDPPAEDPPDEVRPPPLSCSQNADVDVPDPEHKNIHGQIDMIERHYADGSPVDSSITATFLDYSQFTGVRQEGVDLGSRCVGYIGPQVSESAKHCEYTSDTCLSDTDCADGVACRDTDRRVVNGVNVNGLKPGTVTLDELEQGVYAKHGLGEIYSTERYNVNIGASEDPLTMGVWGYFFFYMPSPKLVNVTEPDLSGEGVIKPEDLHFIWSSRRLESYQSRAIFIDLVAEQVDPANPGNTRTARVSCVAYDDTCHTVPTEATTWLLTPEDGWQATGWVDVVVAHHYPMHGPSTELADTDFDFVGAIETHGTLRIE